MIDPNLVLVADIGGTNSRFGLVRAGDLTPRDIDGVDNDSYGGLHEAIAHYLTRAGVRPARAVIAVAGPVQEGTVHLTNRRGWSFKPAELARATGLLRIDVTNDFAALAEALPHLDAADLAPIGAVRPLPDATKIVLGPGTGLGVAALLNQNGLWIAAPSEGGHIEFAPTNAREAVVYEVLRGRFGRVSAEFVASGTGIEHLDAALALIDAGEKTARQGREVSAAARAGELRAREAMDLFFAALARFAGDMALTFVARGGVYVFGGVAQKTLDLMDVEAFRQNFEAKAPHQPLVAAIATTLITARYAALTGCAAVAAKTA